MGDLESLLQRAAVCQRAGLYTDAERMYRLALETDPEDPTALCNLGAALIDLRRPSEALEILSSACSILPSSHQTLTNLGNALAALDRPDEASDAYLAALTAKPDDPEILVNLGSTFLARGRHSEAAATYRRALALDPSSEVAHRNLIFSMHFNPSLGQADILEECRAWDRAFGASVSGPEVHPEACRSGGRLKIGYVGAHFYDHCQSLFTLPLFRSHDRAEVEVFVYSGSSLKDGVTEGLRASVEHWRDIAGVSDAGLARMVAEDRIDVLIDLTMHMAGSRLGAFAARMAPVQVSWLAYPGTTGVSAIDYRLTDPYLDPPGTDESVYSERTMRLPETFWCYDPLSTAPPASEEPSEPGKPFTFGCLNNFCKTNEVTIKLWASAMRILPGSRFLLLAPQGEERKRTLDIFAGEGVSSDRVDFVGRRSRRDYLELYRTIDLCLDTFPYNGHTTSMDAMWMGVPVVTMPGPTVVGRAGVSLAANLKLPELVAGGPQGFIERCATLALDRRRLAAVRSSLRERMRSSPLMNAGRFARAMEEALGSMVHPTPGP